ncbi:hypothetical protein QBC40DRAFT_98398 [Triangularia verruculosa]|uniref:Secreted protein n=1 Tax=Triangularia verruculosa TaxID=2587418 RepID=A0AAN7AYN9_9PEZI|nr:hypothetical protein QBC40DRAFT_98398 [Triangularia verruculosa]
MFFSFLLLTLFPPEKIAVQESGFLVLESHPRKRNAAVTCSSCFLPVETGPPRDLETGCCSTPPVTPDTHDVQSATHTTRTPRVHPSRCSSRHMLHVLNISCSQPPVSSTP